MADRTVVLDAVLNPKYTAEAKAIYTGFRLRLVISPGRTPAIKATINNAPVNTPVSSLALLMVAGMRERPLPRTAMAATPRRVP